MIESTFAVIFLALLFLLWQVICLWKKILNIYEGIDSIVHDLGLVIADKTKRDLEERYGLARQEKK